MLRLSPLTISLGTSHPQSCACFDDRLALPDYKERQGADFQLSRSVAEMLVRLLDTLSLPADPSIPFHRAGSTSASARSPGRQSKPFVSHVPSLLLFLERLTDASNLTYWSQQNELRANALASARALTSSSTSSSASDLTSTTKPNGRKLAETFPGDLDVVEGIVWDSLDLPSSSEDDA